MTEPIRKPVYTAKHGSVWLPVYQYQYAYRNGTRTEYRFTFTEFGKTKHVTSSKLEKIKALASERATLIAQGRVSAISPTQELEVFQKCRNILGEHYSLDNILSACRHYNATVLSVSTKKLLKDAIDEYLAERSSQISPKRLQRIKVVLGRMVEGTYNAMTHALTTADLEATIKNSPGQESTKYYIFAMLSTFVRWCDLKGYLSDGERMLNRMTVRGKKGKGKREVFSAEELRKLMDAAPQELQIIFAICSFGGLRKSEAIALSWSQVDLADGFIRLEGTQVKTGARRGVAILPTLNKWLQTVPASERTGKVWKSTETDYFHAQAKACKQAGVSWKNNAMRHSAISSRCCNGATLNEVADWSGTSVKKIKEHYLALISKADAEAWFQVLPVDKE